MPNKKYTTPMYAYDRDYDSTTGSLAKPANSSLYGSGTYGYNPDTRTMMRQGYEGDQFYPEGVSSMYKRSRQSPQDWQGTRMETPDYQLERSLREGLFDQPQYNRELRRPLEKQTQEDTPISDFFVSKAAASDVIDLLDNLPNLTMRVKSAGVGIPLSPDQLQEYKYGDFADGPPETMMMSSRAQVVDPDFDRVTSYAIAKEGGYKADDEGAGPVNYGVVYSKNTRALNALGINSPEEMVNLTKDQAKEVFKQNYYDKSGVAYVPGDRNQEKYFGMYVNNPRRATRSLQKVVGAKQDGYFGNDTLIALRNFTARNPKVDIGSETEKYFTADLIRSIAGSETWQDNANGLVGRFLDKPNQFSARGTNLNDLTTPSQVFSAIKNKTGIDLSKY